MPEFISIQHSSESTKRTVRQVEKEMSTGTVCTLVISATWEAEIVRLIVRSQFREKLVRH
jgi:hypothetical protein